MDHSLWSVLLKLVNNKTATSPQEWDEKGWDGKGEAIFAIEPMVETSNAQELFQALDPKTQSEVLDILTTVCLEHDRLKHRRWALSSQLDVRSDSEKQYTGGFIEQKIRLLNPLFNLSKAIQPTSIPERFLQTTRWVMAYFSDKDRESLDLALSECVRSMTRR
jgi:hypothetical protein